MSKTEEQRFAEIGERVIARVFKSEKAKDDPGPKTYEIRVSGASRKSGLNGTHPASTDLDAAKVEGKRLAELCPFAHVVLWFRVASGEWLPHTTIQDSLG